MRRTVINICMLGALAALPLSSMIVAAGPMDAAAVVDAAMSGNHDAVKALLKDGADVNTAQADGMTALHWAAEKGRGDLAKLLLYATTSGTTALMCAAAAGKNDAVKLLIEKGANVNAKENVRGETALTFAAAYGRLDVVRELTAHKADVSVTTKVQDLSAFAKEEQERFLAERGAQQGRGGRGGEGRGPQGPQI